MRSDGDRRCARERRSSVSTIAFFPFGRIGTGRTTTIRLVFDANWPLPRRTSRLRDYGIRRLIAADRGSGAKRLLRNRVFLSFESNLVPRGKIQWPQEIHVADLTETCLN